MAGDSYEYTLPGVEDPDNDTIAMSVDLGSALMFTTLNGDSFEFQTQQNHVGTHKVKITLTDGNTSPLTSLNILTVVVKSPTNSGSDGEDPVVNTS